MSVIQSPAEKVRFDVFEVVRSSVEFLQGVEAMLDEGAMADLRALIAEGDAVKSTAWLSRELFGKR